MGSPLTQSLTFHERNILNEEEDRKNRAMNTFFRKVDLESREMLRSTFSPKKPTICINKKDMLEPMEPYDITKGLNHIK